MSQHQACLNSWLGFRTPAAKARNGFKSAATPGKARCVGFGTSLQDPTGARRSHPGCNQSKPSSGHTISAGSSSAPATCAASACRRQLLVLEVTSCWRRAPPCGARPRPWPAPAPLQQCPLPRFCTTLCVALGLSMLGLACKGPWQTMDSASQLATVARDLVGMLAWHRGFMRRNAKSDKTSEPEVALGALFLALAQNTLQIAPSSCFQLQATISCNTHELTSSFRAVHPRAVNLRRSSS